MRSRATTSSTETPNPIARPRIVAARKAQDWVHSSNAAVEEAFFFNEKFKNDAAGVPLLRVEESDVLSSTGASPSISREMWDDSVK